jgi:hypothetical protein
VEKATGAYGIDFKRVTDLHRRTIVCRDFLTMGRVVDLINIRMTIVRRDVLTMGRVVDLINTHMTIVRRDFLTMGQVVDLINTRMFALAFHFNIF